MYITLVSIGALASTMGWFDGGLVHVACRGVGLPRCLNPPRKRRSRSTITLLSSVVIFVVCLRFCARGGTTSPRNIRWGQHTNDDLPIKGSRANCLGDNLHPRQVVPGAQCDAFGALLCVECVVSLGGFGCYRVAAASNLPSLL